MAADYRIGRVSCLAVLLFGFGLQLAQAFYVPGMVQLSTSTMYLTKAVY